MYMRIYTNIILTYVHAYLHQYCTYLYTCIYTNIILTYTHVSTPVLYLDMQVYLHQYCTCVSTPTLYLCIYTCIYKSTVLTYIYCTYRSPLNRCRALYKTGNSHLQMGNSQHAMHYFDQAFTTCDEEYVELLDNIKVSLTVDGL